LIVTYSCWDAIFLERLRHALKAGQFKKRRRGDWEKWRMIREEQKAEDRKLKAKGRSLRSGEGVTGRGTTDSQKKGFYEGNGQIRTAQFSRKT
jgi:hypothetical protein